jgi:hypothetical protein
MSDAERVMRIYDQQVPGSREAYMNDPATHYARSMMRHVLAIAEIAMRAEQIPSDVRFRILMTMAVGQPSTPVDAEMRMEMTKRQLVEATYGLPAVVIAAAAGTDAPKCRRCRDVGYVPDFSHGLDAEFGEPGKKPCPDCQGAVARSGLERTPTSDGSRTCACRYAAEATICTHGDAPRL